MSSPASGARIPADAKQPQSHAVTVEKIERNSKYRELVHQRDTLAWTLSSLVLIIYFGFILMVAFAGNFLASPIATGSVIPIGLPLGVGVILASVLLTAIYVHRANSVFDPLIRDIIKETAQ